MNLPELLRVSFIYQNFIAKLFACQIKLYLSHYVVAVVIPVGPRHAIHLSAENILRQKRGDRTLPESFILRRPVLSHSWRAGIGAPDFGKGIIQVRRSMYSFVLTGYSLYIRLFTAPEFVFHDFSSLLFIQSDIFEQDSFFHNAMFIRPQFENVFN
jgi:hypothetical protein